MKENHGGLFRKVAFASLLEPLVKLKQENQQRSLRLEQIDSKLTELKQLRESFAKLGDSFDALNVKKAYVYEEDADYDELDNELETKIDEDENAAEEISDDDNRLLRQQSLSQVHLNSSNDTESMSSSTTKQPRKHLPKMSIDYSVVKPLDKLSPTNKSMSKADMWSIKNLRKNKIKQQPNSNPSTLPKKVEKDKVKNRSSSSINQLAENNLDKNADTISMTSSHFLSVIQSTAQFIGIENKDNSCSVSNTSSLLQIEFQETQVTRSSLKNKIFKIGANITQSQSKQPKRVDGLNGSKSSREEGFIFFDKL